MNIGCKILIIYLIAINIISLIVCIFDKYRAKKHGWRIRERTLLILSAIGGSIAMYITMIFIRHKTKYKKFMIGIPAIIIIQVILLYIIYTNI